MSIADVSVQVRSRVPRETSLTACLSSFLVTSFLAWFKPGSNKKEVDIISSEWKDDLYPFHFKGKNEDKKMVYVDSNMNPCNK